MKTIFFDIETGPLSESELEFLLPPFDPNEVKIGNLKDPEKIAAKREGAKTAHWRDFVRHAALDPLSGRVLAIGLLFENGDFSIIGNDNESELLQDFWGVCRSPQGFLNRMIGFNTRLFDLPFLIRRSFKFRIPIPAGVRQGRYWGEEMVDLREIWQLGDRQAHGSLDTIAGHLGVGRKDGCGEDFARLWRDDHEKAVAYLRTDLDLTHRVAEAMGVIEPMTNRLQWTKPIVGSKHSDLVEADLN